MIDFEIPVHLAPRGTELAELAPQSGIFQAAKRFGGREPSHREQAVLPDPNQLATVAEFNGQGLCIGGAVQGRATVSGP